MVEVIWKHGECKERMALKLVGENRTRNKPGRGFSVSLHTHTWQSRVSLHTYPAEWMSKAVAQSIRNNVRISSEDQRRKIFE